MSKLVVIEDSTILSLVRNPAHSAAIPCFTNKAKILDFKKSACGTCAAKKKAQQRQTMAGIKSCLAALSSAKKVELKKILEADQVRVTYTNASGKVVQVTF